MMFLYITYLQVLVTIRFFKEASVEEREHAEKFMEYQVLFCASMRLHV